MEKLVTKPRWIPADRMIPEENELVLIYYEYFRYGSYDRMTKSYGIGHVYKGKWYGLDALGNKAKVLYWMPLPDEPVEK